MDERRPPDEPVEIEHKFLLDGTPDIPEGIEKLRLEQGYLPKDFGGSGGRIRRTIHPDGSVSCTRTIKTGHGLVRTEWEERISEAQFQDLWPATEGARIRKTRYQFREGPVVWAVDCFDDLNLVLAEAELPDVATPCPPPPWLAQHIIAEVTDDPQYQNVVLAMQIGASDRGG